MNKDYSIAWMRMDNGWYISVHGSIRTRYVIRRYWSGDTPGWLLAWQASGKEIARLNTLRLAKLAAEAEDRKLQEATWA